MIAVPEGKIYRVGMGQTLETAGKTETRPGRRRPSPFDQRGMERRFTPIRGPGGRSRRTGHGKIADCGSTIRERNMSPF